MKQKVRENALTPAGGRHVHKVVQVPATSLRPLEAPEAYQAVPRRLRTLDGQVREAAR